ncbi:MAG TPA: single-stranded-DNA-specific exonuclease RecJ, partial [Anaerolineaceae bacterium]|nr:single-stranded-DNA-specific exonuclease RecJ [Anaerolineaceae bacterium]
MIMTKWVEKQKLPVSEDIRNLYSNPWIQQILSRNNIRTISQANKFIDPQNYEPTSPTELPDLEIAAERLIKAIQQDEKIGIWGDFDVDGQTSTTLLYEGLTNLGAKVTYYIPIRAKESHGINLPSLKEFLKRNISVLLTCDTGISENESISYANQQGVDVLITDHHSLPETLPDALAKVNPQRLPADHPLSNLSGVGVAFKLIEYLYQYFDVVSKTEQFLDLVALGTVADVAILSGENRYLVQKGLLSLQNPARLGLQEIYKNKKFQNGQITEMHIGFYLAPLLNALGRLSDANPIVEFLTTKDLQKAQVFSIQLENINERRKLITDQISEAVIFSLEQNSKLLNEPSIILHHPDWEAGVLGIVANRLVEKFNKPTILMTGKEDIGFFGSARSIEGLNIIQSIQANAHYLKHFGGHAMAAGLSMTSENLLKFKTAFNKSVLEIVGDSVLQKDLQIDGFIDFDLINLDFVREIESLAPFGAGNPAPIFASKNIHFKNIQRIGKKSEHLKIKAFDSSDNFQDLLWWRADINEIPEENVDVAYKLHSSNYLGRENVQVEIVAIQPAEQTIAELQSSKDRLEIFDYRQDPPTDFDWVKRYPDVLWFEEGIEAKFSPRVNRQNLQPAETLILYTLPPNLTELKKIFITVRPKTLFLFGNSPFPGSLNNTIKNV